MRVSVDGTSLWFDVDGPAMRERPMVVLLLGIFHDAVYPQTEIVKAQIVKATKVRYHWVSSVFGSGWCCNRFLTKPGVSLSTNPI